MEIAALPSCEKSLFAGAKVAIFFYKRFWGGFLVKGYSYASLGTTHGFCFGRGWFIGLGGAFEFGLYPRTMEPATLVPKEEYHEGFKETRYPYEGDMMVKVYLALG